MPIAIRPSDRSWRVAYALASTVGSRVAGFVTKCPSLIVEVSRAAIASIGTDSCQRTCESYVHAYPKPWRSASWISSSQRENGGSGRTVTPKSTPASLTRRRERGERRQDAEDDEADPAVTGERERQADEGRSHDDGQRGPRVHEADGRSRIVRPCRGGARERTREGNAGGEAEDGGGGDVAHERQREGEHGGGGAAEDEARRDDPARVLAPEQRAARDPREEPEQERERPDHRCRRLRLSMALEQGHDPVADDHAEAERERVDRSEPVQAHVADEAPAEPLACMPQRA